MTDDLPDWTAQLDQMRRGLKDIAAVIHDYHAALLEEGFTPEQAFMLTIAFQTQMQRGGAEE